MNSFIRRRNAERCLQGIGIVCVAAILALATPASAVPKKWAVLRCYPTDAHFSTAPIPSFYAADPDGFFRDLLTETGQGAGGMYDYWTQISNDPTLIKGSKVFPWAPANLSSNAFMSLDNNASQYCLDRSIDAGVVTKDELNGFNALIIIINTVDGDHGLTGGTRGTSAAAMSINNQPWRMLPLVGTTTYALSPMSLAHEMGHGYGLAHATCSSSSSTDDYCDVWDVMGGSQYAIPPTFFLNPIFAKVVTTNNLGRKEQANIGWSGPGLNAQHLTWLGWIPSQRTYVYDSSQPGKKTVTLAALGHWETPGVFQVGVTPDVAPPDGYTIEFRHSPSCLPPTTANCWDQSVPDSVQIHTRWSSTGFQHTYIVDDRGGALWAPGQTFFDGNLKIFIDSFDLPHNTATITLQWQFDSSGGGGPRGPGGSPGGPSDPGPGFCGTPGHLPCGPAGPRHCGGMNNPCQGHAID